MTKTVTTKDGYRMTATYLDAGNVRIDDSNGEIKVTSNADWQRMAELAEHKGATLN